MTEFQAQRAIEQAVATIQRRGSGKAGALSIAAPLKDAGMLALAESAGGTLVVVSDLEPPTALPQEGSTDDAEASIAEASGDGRRHRESIRSE